MTTDEDFEARLAAALVQAGDGFHSDPARLESAGMARGRSGWRRRTAFVAVGSAAALVLVAGGTYAVVRPGDASAPHEVAGPVAGPTEPTGSPSAGVPSGQVLAVLRSVLPSGVRLTDADGGRPRVSDPGLAGVRALYDDGHGAAMVSVTVQRRTGPWEAGSDEFACPDRKLTPYDACRTTTLADGSVLMVHQGYERPDRPAEGRWWHATFGGRDGRLIDVSEWNSAEEKDAPVTRERPPLTPDQLTAAVTSKAWDGIVSALRPRPAAPARPGPQFPAADILATVARLLPPGLKETETGGQDGYANFVVRDAKGPSMVEINVEDWSRQLAGKGGQEAPGSSIADGFAGAEELPDGTLVLERRQGKNPVGRVVDTLRPNGLRIVIVAYNSGSLRKAASRDEPALTSEQLRAIALSPEWHLPG